MTKKKRSKARPARAVQRPQPRPAPGGYWARFTRMLFRPVDPLPLGIFRALFGLWLCLEFFVVSRNTFPADYVKPLFHFTYPLFDDLGLKPLSTAHLWVMFYVMEISSIGVMLGLVTRLSLIVLTATFGYFFFLESSVYSNHYYLIFLLSFLLCFGHSGASFSLDCLFRKKACRERIAFWEIFLLRFQVCVVFFYGALAKMSADWLIYAAPLYLNFIKHFTLLGHPLQEKWIAVVLSWGGMISDLALGVLLLLNRWPRVTFIWLCLFNGLNIFLFGLGIKTFPYLMISTYILFLPGSAVRAFLARFVSRKFSPDLSPAEQV